MSEFKVGDLVAPTKKALESFPYNKFGEGWGVVIHDSYSVTDFYEFQVRWEGGNPAFYNSEHLELYNINLENK